MPILIWTVVLLTAAWSGWWWVGKQAMERGTDAFFARLEDEGWQAGHGGRGVVGYPNRLDLTVTEPALRDPLSGAGWQAPFVQILTLSYRPWHLIAAFPNDQRLLLPSGAALALRSDRLRASLRVEPNTTLALDRITLVGDALRLETGAGGVGIGTLRFATRQAPALALGHEAALEALDVAPDPAFLAALPAGSGLPALIDRLRLDMELGFTAALDRNAASTRPELKSLLLREAALTWGDLTVHGTGRLIADASGLAEGRIDWRVDNWRMALAAAQAAGLVSPEVAPTWANALSLLSQAGGVPGRIDLPLVMQGGRMSLGPLPLGRAPVFGPPQPGNG